MTVVLWTPSAREDLREIYRYIAHDSPQYADFVVSAISGAVTRLELFPESGRIVPEDGRPEIREVIWRSYRIVYAYVRAKDQVHILTVFRSERLFLGLRGGHGGV